MHADTLALNLSRRLRMPLLARDAALVLGGSLLIALCAQISVPLFPVPITAQTFAVLLVGASLGARRGALSVALYLAEGLAGLPVFAGGELGPSVLFGPRGGYLLGFIPGAFVVGMLAERGLDRSWKTALPVFLAGEAMIFAVGLAWLSALIGREQAIAVGLLPFIPGELIKIALAALALPAAWSVAERSRS
jgi:biotin transport system substrate-specific component